MSYDLRCRILNTDISVATVEDAVAFFAGDHRTSLQGRYICNVSVDDVMYADKNPSYREIVNNAALILPNSRQISSEMHLQGYPKASKIGVVELMERVLEAGAGQSNQRHFFIVSADRDRYADGTSILKNLLKKIKREYPDIQADGWEYSASELSDKAIDKADRDSGYKDALAEQIQAFGADIIWVGLPSPLQEEWMAEHEGMFDGIMVGVDYGLYVYTETEEKKADNNKKGIRYGIKYLVSRCRQLPRGYIKKNLLFIWLTGKKFIWKTLCWTPAIATVLTIFILSSQNGVASAETSQSLTMSLAHLVSGENVTYSNASEIAALEALDVFIRMLAHMGEYAFLSLMVGLAVTVNGFHGKIRMFYMCFFGVLTAGCDEFFQVFVPGRYGDLSDILFDSLGVIAAAVTWYIFGKKAADKKSAADIGIQESRRKFMNLCLDDITFEEAVREIGRMACDEGKHYVVTPNVDHVVKIEKDLELRKIYENADLILTDGTPLMWIAESLGAPIKEKITGADMFPKVCEMAAETGYTMFFLGAGPGAAERAKERLEKKYPGLSVVGTYSPPMDFEKNKKEVDKTIKIINEKCPQILVVGLGCPKQEKFIYKYLDRMNIHVALPFGAAIDFEAGIVKRAPLWMRKIGMEWFFRFLQEPGRLFVRYFIDDMKIFWLAWRYRFEIIRLRDVTSAKEK